MSNTFKPNDAPNFRAKDIAMIGPIRNNKLPIILDFANQKTEIVIVGMDDELADVHTQLLEKMEAANEIH